ncbi:filaggrin-like isoform X2 [Acanthaster planci]|uniref:RING-type E3 ubiquitin transferase n=1 Tax=Acanthaster planci TaxID=133434 RepID=A0A8B8A1A3_ACAPL|nr:filaggrin-like isoform X2 [Acanthaster planci]
MSSSSSGPGLPSIDSSHCTRAASDKTRERPSRDLPGVGYTPQGTSTSFQSTPKAKRDLRPRLPSQQVSRGENGRHHLSVHNRPSRSLATGTENADRLRNWNSEGGRPKRERVLSERTNSKRLLHRSSINSSGELIPFQRAPRDGSYESRLPVGKKATLQNPARQNSLFSSTESEHRRAARLQESPESVDELSSSSVAENAERSQSLSLDETKHSSKAKVLKKSSDSRKDGMRAPRQLSTQGVGNGVRKAQSENKHRRHTQSDITSHGVPSLSKKEQSTSDNESEETAQHISNGMSVSGFGSSSAISSNIAENTLEANARPDLQQTGNGPSSQSASSSQNSFREPPIHNVFDGCDLASSHSARAISPSAEFKAAAQPESSAGNEQSSVTSSISSTIANTNNRSALQSESEANLQAPSNNESDVSGGEPLLSSQQPNSVIRRRMNLDGTADTSQIQPSQVSTPSFASNYRPSRRRDEISSHSDQTSSGHLTTAGSSTPEGPELPNERGSSASQQLPSPRVSPHLVHATQPPSSSNMNSTSAVNPSSTSQQARHSRFGRRIRMPSSDLDAAGESTHPTHDASGSPTPAVEEPFEGTNRQRYRFFSLSRGRSQTNHEVQASTLTPNRDLLYGPPSPPLLRRHHRAHFGPDTSTSRQTSEELGASIGIHSSFSSSVGSGDLALQEDSFRTASGSTVAFSPILHSGPVLDSSMPHQRWRMRETATTSGVTAHGRLSSSEITSPRQLRATSSPETQNGGAGVNLSSDFGQDNFTFSVEEGRLSRDARRRYQNDRSDAIPRLLPQRSHQPSRELSRGAEVMEDVFGSSQDRNPPSDDSPLRDPTLELQIPLLSSPLFSPLGIAPGMLLSLLIRTRREFGQEFMELLLENMMLNVLAHHLFENERGGNEDGINGAPPPATQEVIDNLKEIPALESHIEKEMKCAICHSEYELYETLAELPCEHFFHPTCVAVWLKKSGTCPVCRFLLPSPSK